MQELLISTFKSEMQRPSDENEWQIPGATALPMPLPPTGPLRLTPLDVQAASYFALSARMFSFSRMSIKHPALLIS